MIDVGGTSADVGVLAGGFPRQSNSGVDIGGIRTNFRMPDLVTIAVGGGTVVVEETRRFGSAPRAWATASPRTRSCSAEPFPTLTDAAVAAGRLAIGDVERGRRPRDFLARGSATLPRRCSPTPSTA